jgi:hypothetical protein
VLQRDEPMHNAAQHAYRINSRVSSWGRT